MREKLSAHPGQQENRPNSTAKIYNCNSTGRPSHSVLNYFKRTTEYQIQDSHLGDGYQIQILLHTTSWDTLYKTETDECGWPRAGILV